MIIVVADTSGLLAALDSTHPEHQGANEAIMAAGLLVMSPLLLAELDHVATRELSREAAISAVGDVRRWMQANRVVVPEITEAHLAAAQSLRARCGTLVLDLADVVNVALASDHDTDTVITLDRRDFRALRPLGHALRLPDSCQKEAALTDAATGPAPCSAAPAAAVCQLCAVSSPACPASSAAAAFSRILRTSSAFWSAALWRSRLRCGPLFCRSARDSLFRWPPPMPMGLLMFLLSVTGSPVMM